MSRRPVKSALYRFLDGMVTGSTHMFRVGRLLTDSRNIEEEVMNPETLRNRLHREIRRRYNARLVHYRLNSRQISEDSVDTLQLVRPRTSSVEDGQYQLFPRAFCCKSCGRYVTYQDSRQMRSAHTSGFNLNNCGYRGCSGKMEQITVVGYCKEVCGHTRHLSWGCPTHNYGDILLKRPRQDRIGGWYFECTRCRERMDVFRFQCYHEDGLHTSDADRSKYTAESVTEGGSASPVTLKLIDLPKVTDDPAALQWHALGLYLGRLRSPDTGKPLNYKDLKDFLEYYNNEISKKREFAQSSEDPDTDIDDWWGNYDFGHGSYRENIENEIGRLVDDYGNLNLDNIIQFDYLKKEKAKNDRFILSKRNPSLLAELREDLKIKNISYLEDVDLLYAAIGIIIGGNDWWDPDFVAPFEPIWSSNPWSERGSTIEGASPRAYIYPFKTEGVLIEIELEKIIDWIGNTTALPGGTSGHAREILLQLKQLGEDSEHYRMIKNLLHTISHLVIKRSSLYTGLDITDCGEIVFPEAGAIFIYSTSAINTGGFQFAFESSLSDWFANVREEAELCSMDPICIKDSGSCFSCLHIPEFVCDNFNLGLDRDALIGSGQNENEHRINYSVGFWQR